MHAALLVLALFAPADDAAEQPIVHFGPAIIIGTMPGPSAAEEPKRKTIDLFRRDFRDRLARSVHHL